MHAVGARIGSRRSGAVLAGAALAAVTIAYFAISPLALVALGFSYEDTGGGPLEKVHPATFVAALLLFITGLSSRNPLRAAITRLAEAPGTLALLGATAFLIAYAIVILKQPFTLMIDTFVAPVLVYHLVQQFGDRGKQRLAFLLHVLMLTNALIGILEYLSGLRLTPLVANGQELNDWRSTALLGHPLSNAVLTGVYLLALITGASRSWSPFVKTGAVALSAAGLVVFGGRASVVFLGAFVAIIAIANLFGVLAGRRLSRGKLALGLIMAPMAICVVLGLAAAGFFDQFAARFIEDEGSASTRIAMFQLFQHFTWTELLFKPDAGYLSTLKDYYGLEFGIESFWVSFSLYFGLIPSTLLFIALGWFCYDVLRNTSGGAILILIYFFAVASTSVSLSAKSPILAMVTLLLLVLLPRTNKRSDRYGLSHRQFI